jgi:hypothetical protein
LYKAWRLVGEEFEGDFNKTQIMHDIRTNFSNIFFEKKTAASVNQSCTEHCDSHFTGNGCQSGHDIFWNRVEEERI